MGYRSTVFSEVCSFRTFQEQQYTTYQWPRPGSAHENTWAASGLGRATHKKPTSHSPRPDSARRIASLGGGLAGALKIFKMMGRGPARPIKLIDAGPRPGPSHHTFKFSRPVKILISARPGPHYRRITRPAKDVGKKNQHESFEVGFARIQEKRRMHVAINFSIPGNLENPRRGGSPSGRMPSTSTKP